MRSVPRPAEAALLAAWAIPARPRHDRNGGCRQLRLWPRWPRLSGQHNGLGRRWRSQRRPGWSTGEGFGSLGFGLTGTGSWGAPGASVIPVVAGGAGPGGMTGTSGVGYGQAGVGSQGFGTGTFGGDPTGGPTGNTGNVGWATGLSGGPGWASGDFGQYGGFEGDQGALGNFGAAMAGPDAVSAVGLGELGDKGSTGYQGGNVGITGAVDDAMAMNQAQAMTQAGPFDAQARGEQDRGGPPDPATETLSTPQQAIDAAFNTLSMSPDVPGTLGPDPGSRGHFAATFGPFGPTTATPSLDPPGPPFGFEPDQPGPTPAPTPAAPGPQDQPSRGLDLSQLSMQFANPDLGLLGAPSPSQNTGLGLGGQTNAVYDPRTGQFRNPQTGQVVPPPGQAASLLAMMASPVSR